MARQTRTVRRATRSIRRQSTPFWITKLGQLYKLVRESHEAPLAGEPQPLRRAIAGETVITWIGHSSFLLQIAGRSVLVDPVFATRLIVLRRQRRPGLRLVDLPSIDAVLLTHAHMDHLNRPSLRAITQEMRRRALPAPIALVPPGVEDLVCDLGFRRIETVAWWQTVQPAELAPLHVTGTPAKHWGARMFNDTQRGFGGYVLDAPGVPGVRSVYHSGDTAFFPGFGEIGQRLHPQVALLPIGAYFPDSYRAVHTSPEEALEAFVELGAEKLVPMHFGTFRLGREPMSEPLPRLRAAAARRGMAERLRPLREGESLVLGSPTELAAD